MRCQDRGCCVQRHVSSDAGEGLDRKSTRLNSSHLVISYAVFCLKKKKKLHTVTPSFCHEIHSLFGIPSSSILYPRLSRHWRLTPSLSSSLPTSCLLDALTADAD